MSCGICHALMPQYCTCDDLVDDGQPITPIRKSEVIKIRVERLSTYLDSIDPKIPMGKAANEIRKFLHIE